jgi:hypothetical protein
MNSPKITLSSNQNKFSNLREIMQRAQNDPRSISGWNTSNSTNLTAQREYSKKQSLFLKN